MLLIRLSGVKMGSDKSVWDPSVLINGVSGDKTAAGEQLSAIDCSKHALQYFGEREGGLNEESGCLSLQRPAKLWGIKSREYFCRGP